VSVVSAVAVAGAVAVGSIRRGGGGSGLTSITGQGAWSTTKRVGGARLCGPSRLRGTVAGADEQVGAGRGVHDLTLDPAGAFEAFGWPGQSGSGGGEQRCAQRNHRRGSQSLRSDP
jgi:hypothetical protein